MAIMNSTNSFMDGDPHHIETSLLIYFANQWTDFYMIRTSVMNELNYFTCFISIPLETWVIETEH